MEREQWGSRLGFILAAVGSAIGLGNIWRFPYIVYENGGGAFLIPYLFAMLTAGIPFMILEFALGHKFRGSAPRTLASINSKLQMLGWVQVFIAFTIAVYYAVIVAWAFSYLGFSFNLSWGDAPQTFFFEKYLNFAGSPTDLGSVQFKILIPLAIAWSITFITTFTGIKFGIEAANKILMPLLFLLVIIFIIKVLTLDGAIDGINYLFTPDFSKILDPKVWTAAYGQIFFTLSVGFAIMITYSSYLPQKTDISNNAFMTVFINCGFSMLAGLMIFGVLGYMAQASGKPITEVVSSGVGLAFITLPAAINEMPAPQFFGVAFFLTLVFAGISSHISISEACISAFMDKTGWQRKAVSTLYCGLGFILSINFTTNGGLALLDVIDHFVNNIGILTTCLIELLFLGWFFNLESIREYVNKISDFAIGTWWSICIRFVTIAILAISIITNVITIVTKGYGGYSTLSINIFGWGICISIIVLALILTNVTCPKGYIPTGENRKNI